MKVLVDTLPDVAEKIFDCKFDHNSRREDYAHDWEEMELTPNQIYTCINNCIDIKMIEK